MAQSFKTTRKASPYQRTAGRPDSQYRTLEGQTHMVNAKVQTPILVEFFNGETSHQEFPLGAASLAVK